jgi:hypothetical protein
VNFPKELKLNKLEYIELSIIYPLLAT